MSSVFQLKEYEKGTIKFNRSDNNSDKCDNKKGIK